MTDSLEGPRFKGVWGLALFRLASLFLATHKNPLYLLHNLYPRVLTMESPFRIGQMDFKPAALGFQDLAEKTTYHVKVFFTFFHEPHTVSAVNDLS